MGSIGSEHVPAGAPPAAPQAPEDLSPRYEPKTKAYRRYVSGYALASVAFSLLWGAVLTVLLPLQVQALEFARIFGPDSGVDLTALNNLSSQVASGAVTPTAEQRDQLNLLAEFNSSRAAGLSLVTSAGVVIGMFLSPIIGTLSDRTRTKWGRRTPYIAAGAVLGAAAISLMPLAPNLVLLVLIWSIVQVAGNAQGPLVATVADRVPEDRLGSVSAVTGVVVYFAAIVGAVVAGMLFGAIGLASYYPFAVTLLLLTVPLILLARDRSSKHMPREKIRIRTLFASFVIALRDRDYRWAWISKVLLWSGFGIGTTYGIYMLQSYITPALSAEEAAQMAPLLQVVALPATMVAMAVSGRLSDKLRRRKPFVVAAAIIIAVGFLVPWVWPSLPAMFIQAALGGLGLGAFLVVDQALFIDLLPDPEARGRDLGMSAVGQNLGNAIAPIIAGTAVAVVGGSYGVVWPIAFIIVVVAGLAVLPIRRAR
ncbi:MFS transporter [Pseudarthrobacter sp. R1]|uniref:MFS transporter n=1 Tax=Pseudarthrobacter sp. R1 TaxID=2944934 RepID=UPI002109EECF|nr:MFS transporter [Pseudarthrobacter sp. R1]MCQ6272455.1 MFS transporter [Pseudarthrobacter sp. R1]